MNEKIDAAAKWLDDEAPGELLNKIASHVSFIEFKEIREALASLLAAYAAHEVEAGKWMAINSEDDLPESGSWVISQSRAGAVYPRFYSVEDKQYWLDNFVAYQRMPASYVPAQQEEQV
jgi:hypothetical protein